MNRIPLRPLVLVAAVTIMLAGGLADAGVAASFPGQNGKIVFHAPASPYQHDIYVISPDGSGLTNLTNHPANDTDPAWSPDGTRIVFSSDRDAGNGSCAPRCSDEIYVMNSDGTGVKRLTESAYLDADPAWSPDGMKLVFATERFGPRRFHGDLMVMNADGSGLARLTGSSRDDRGPVWSPDGTKIAFFEVFGPRLMVIDPNGANRTFLAGGSAWPSWSPDSSKLAFTSAPGGSDWDIFLMNRDGTGRVQLANPGANEYAPEWSPDGAKVVYESVTSFCDESGCDIHAGDDRTSGPIHVMNANGSERTALAASGRRPDWQPTGGSPASSTLEVVLAGSGQGGVTSTPAGIQCPSDCTETYPTGTAVELRARTRTGTEFVGWSGDCSGSELTCTIVMNGDKTVSATFAKTG